MERANTLRCSSLEASWICLFNLKHVPNCIQLLHPFWESLGNMSLSAAYFQVFVGRFCVLDARAVLGYLYMGGVGAASRPLGQVSLRRTSSPTKISVERLPGFWFMVRFGISPYLMMVIMGWDRGCHREVRRKIFGELLLPDPTFPTWR